MKPPDPKDIAASLGGDSEGSELGPEGGEQGPESDLESALADLCDAFEAKDYKSAAIAFKQALTFAQSAPDDEAAEQPPEPQQ